MKTSPASVDWKGWRHQYALRLREEHGLTQMQIAEALGVSQGLVSRWLSAAEREGEQALGSHPHRGAASRLTPEQFKLIPDYLSHGAEAYGFRGELWTAARVARVIQEEFGVEYHKRHVRRLLKKLNWTP